MFIAQSTSIGYAQDCCVFALAYDNKGPSGSKKLRKIIFNVEMSVPWEGL
jgi:hypothetical protein